MKVETSHPNAIEIAKDHAGLAIVVGRLVYIALQQLFS
jgi:hypothetical protein